MSEIDGFPIIELVGEGGFGRVYSSRDKVTGTPIAIKTLSASLSSSLEAEEEFRREYGILEQLNDPGVVDVYRKGWDPTHGRYFTMPFLTGGTLEEVRVSGAFSIARMINLWLEIAAIVERCHHQGACHRDLKPKNIVFNDMQRPILVDFGIGRNGVVGSHGTSPKGTPGWSPPEMEFRGKAGAFTDTFGLCALLGWILTGKRPVEFITAPTPQEDEALYQAIVRGLSSESDRYQSVNELWQVLRGPLFEWKRRWVYSHLDTPTIAVDAIFYDLFQNNTNSLMPKSCQLDFYKGHPHFRVGLSYTQLHPDDRGWIDLFIQMGLTYAESDGVPQPHREIWRICSVNGSIGSFEWIMGPNVSISARVLRTITQLSDRHQVIALEFLLLAEKYRLSLN